MNLDLTYAVKFNLAMCYQRNKMYTEAINAYNLIVKNKQYPQAGRLRVNIGNIFFAQKKYKNAIREYKMALDQIPNDRKETRFKIMRNIGHAYVRLGQFNDAIEHYEVMVDQGKPENTGFPDLSTPFNLLICYYARAMGSDSSEMRRGFTTLLEVPQPAQLDAEDPDALPAESKMGTEKLKMALAAHKNTTASAMLCMRRSRCARNVLHSL